MTLTNQRFSHSDIALRETGFMALVRSLGYADTLRFLNQLLPGQGDYLEWQEQIFGDASVDEIYEQAQKHWGQIPASPTHFPPHEAS
jgi:hypothetical protein